MSKNQAVSIRQRLLNLAKLRREDFNFVLRQFVLQRLMYRLAVSDYVDDFLLKGGLLFWVWNENFHRPTQDMDLLAFGSDDMELLNQKFSQIMQLKVDDGLVFNPKDLQLNPIKEDDKYQGIRLTGKAFLTNAEIPFQIDIGFGDAVKTVSQYSEIPAFLDDLPKPKLKIYPVYTVIAEKFHAMIYLGLSNSRMKDFFDLNTIAQTMPLSFDVLQDAITATFIRRRLDVSDATLMIFSDTFRSDSNKGKQWQAFKRKYDLELQDDFAETINKIQQLLEPIYQQITQNKKIEPQQWNNCKWRWEKISWVRGFDTK